MTTSPNTLTVTWQTEVMFAAVRATLVANSANQAAVGKNPSEREYLQWAQSPVTKALTFAATPGGWSATAGVQCGFNAAAWSDGTKKTLAKGDEFVLTVSAHRLTIKVIDFTLNPDLLTRGKPEVLCFWITDEDLWAQAGGHGLAHQARATGKQRHSADTLATCLKGNGGPVFGLNLTDHFGGDANLAGQMERDGGPHCTRRLEEAMRALLDSAGVNPGASAKLKLWKANHALTLDLTEVAGVVRVIMGAPPR